MKWYVKWGLGALALLCAFGLGKGGDAYTENDLALAREEAYNSGYQSGFTDGSAEQDRLYQEAFTKGHLEGYDLGFAEGSAQGVPEEPAPQEELASAPLPVLTEPAVSVTAPAAEEEPSIQTVYVTKSGTKYHLSSCSHLSKSKIEKTLSDAKAAGYTPCKTCKPPQ